MEQAVVMSDISKVYPSNNLLANDRVNFDVGPGEIICLAGENGAGKTTLMKILYGMEQPTGGSITVFGKPAHIRNPLDANRLGIGMVHQHFMLVPEYTVAQNVVMGVEPTVFGFTYDIKAANRQVNDVITRHGFSIAAEQKVSSLTVGQMQQVEIVKMLYREVDILILDEPTAVLTEKEIAALFETLQKLAAGGKSLILITHKLHEIKHISHRVAVMRKGKMVDVCQTGEVDTQEISRMMVGKSVELSIEKRSSTQKPGKPVIRFEGVTVERRGQKRPLLHNVTFNARSGEILGFAAVAGNGLGVLEAVLGGFLPVTKGKVFHGEKQVTNCDTKELRKRGLAYVPADRLQVGSALPASVKENLIIASRAQFSKKVIMDSVSINQYTDRLLRDYDVKAQSSMPVGTLSGGNIQKLILAREIEQYHDYIVFSEPTWGLDIASSQFVYKQMEKLRDSGAAVLLISSNLDEILTVADRILVFFSGETVAALCCEESESVSKELIGDYMLGLKRQERSELEAML
ncbi:MAG: ABC transporter ATP-binding protein [Spirochaetota bacterium]